MTNFPNIATGAPVRGRDLWGREQLIANTWQRLGGASVLLAAPRRHGKTSVMYGLHDHPQPGWECALTDVEYMKEPTDVLEAMMAALLANQPIRRALKGLQHLPKKVGAWFASTFSEIETSASVAQIRLQLKDARPTREWPALAELVSQTLGALSSTTKHLIILDEFPIFVQKSLARDHDDTVGFLQWFRALRQEHSNVHFLLGGSINLETTLAQIGESSLINDLEVVHLRAFSDTQAVTFVAELLSGALDEVPPWLPSKIYEHVGSGVPFFLQLLTQLTVDAARIEGMDITENSVEQLYLGRLLGPDCRTRFDHYRSRLNEHYPGKELDIANAALAKLARQGEHDEPQLVALLAAETDEPPLTIERTILHLETDYYVRRERGRVMFLHQVLADWWKLNMR